MVDSAGHGHGPDSPQAHAALAEVDAAIGRLRAGLVERGLLDHANLMIVSDHGMATVAPGHAIAIADLVSREAATGVSTIGKASCREAGDSTCRSWGWPDN